MKITEILTLQYKVEIDSETGEVLSINPIKKSLDSLNTKETEISSDKPQLSLEENKYILNAAAVQLMNANPSDKIDIKYESRGKTSVPIIGKDEAFGTHSGNKLSKNNSVTFRGTKNAELAKHGTLFTLVPHESKKDLFLLLNEEEELYVKDELKMEDDVVMNPDDIDISELFDMPEELTEVPSTYFNL